MGTPASPDECSLCSAIRTKIVEWGKHCKTAGIVMEIPKDVMEDIRRINRMYNRINSGFAALYNSEKQALQNMSVFLVREFWSRPENASRKDKPEIVSRVT
jgi:hypothetical protein